MNEGCGCSKHEKSCVIYYSVCCNPIHSSNPTPAALHCCMHVFVSRPATRLQHLARGQSRMVCSMAAHKPQLLSVAPMYAVYIGVVDTIRP